MDIINLEQGGVIELDLTADGFTDTYEMDFPRNLQIVRTTGTGNPLIALQISNDGVNWSDWEISGFIFKDLNWMFEFELIKQTLFRISWLSNSSTGTFTANFNRI